MVNGKLLDATVSLGVWAIVIAVVLIILAQMQNIDIVNSTVNATIQQFIEGISEFGDWVSIIVVILIASFIIMLVMKALKRSND